MTLWTELALDAREKLCAWLASDPASRSFCPAADQEPTAVAWSLLAFAFWMFAIGGAFFVIPHLRGRASERIVRFSKAIGFPTEAGTWSELFGVALAGFGLFYIVAGLLEVPMFSWMSVFGRLGVFVVCVLLSWNHRRQEEGTAAQPPIRLLWLALPDVVGATVTACLLLSGGLARAAFILGVADCVAALGFLTFPAWLGGLFHMPERGETWNYVLGAVLVFFGTYAMAAAVSGIAPISWIAIRARLLMSLVLLIFCVLQWRKEERSTLDHRRLGAAALVQLIFTVGATVLLRPHS